MSTILDTERATYDEAWALDGYADHAPGEHWLPLFLGMTQGHRGTLLDAGCGSGKGAVKLAEAGFDVTLVDMTDAGLIQEARALPFAQTSLWHDLSSVARSKGHPSRTTFDWTYCCDVLEHLPTPFTMLAVDQLLRVTRRGLFLSIALVPDSFGVWVGKPLHQTVQGFTWWRDNLKELGTVREARDCHQTGVYLLEPR